LQRVERRARLPCESRKDDHILHPLR
jgi:hypothetical protein